MERLLGAKTIRIEHNLEPLGMSINDNESLKVDKVLSNNIRIAIRLKGDLSELGKNYGLHDLLTVKYIKGTVKEEMKAKCHSIHLSKPEVNYEIAYLPDTTWGGLYKEAVEINPVDYIAFDSPLIGLEFDVACYLKD